jgi:inner membrane protein
VASAITHALVGAAIGFITTSFAFADEPRLRRWFPLVTACAAVLPDLDVVMHAWVKYSHPFGHRGAFHSLGFYLLFAVSCGATSWFRGHRAVAIISLLAALLSHSLLDMLTTGGLGIAILWPLSGRRWFFPWRPIPVSPLSISSFFSVWGLRVLSVELKFALPLFAGALLLRSVAVRRKRRT